MLRKIAIVIAAFLFAFPLMGADSCTEEDPTVKKQGGGEATGETAQVGDKLTLKGTTYQVKKVETAKEVGDKYTGAKANGEFVIVDVSLTNEKDEPATILGDNLRIIGGNGSSYSTSDDALLAFSDQTFLLEEIQPGVTETGKLVYDLPPAAVKGAKLQVEDLFSSSTGDINLGL
jgi:hypothetical protein